MQCPLNFNLIAFIVRKADEQLLKLRARGRPFNGNPVKRRVTGSFNGNGNGRLTISDNGNTVKTANFRYKAFYKVMVLGFN